jgi:hypothetical protein
VGARNHDGAPFVAVSAPGSRVHALMQPDVGRRAAGRSHWSVIGTRESALLGDGVVSILAAVYESAPHLDSLVFNLQPRHP